jgi:hypothetical protein
MFGRYLQISPRDMIQYTDKGGNLRTIFVSAQWDGATRGSNFVVPCTERQ